MFNDSLELVRLTCSRMFNVLVSSILTMQRYGFFLASANFKPQNILILRPFSTPSFLRSHVREFSPSRERRKWLVRKLENSKFRIQFLCEHIETCNTSFYYIYNIYIIYIVILLCKFIFLNGCMAA